MLWRVAKGGNCISNGISGCAVPLGRWRRGQGGREQVCSCTGTSRACACTHACMLCTGALMVKPKTTRIQRENRRAKTDILAVISSTYEIQASSIDLTTKISEGSFGEVLSHVHMTCTHMRGNMCGRYIVGTSGISAQGAGLYRPDCLAHGRLFLPPIPSLGSIPGHAARQGYEPVRSGHLCPAPRCSLAQRFAAISNSRFRWKGAAPLQRVAARPSGLRCVPAHP